MSRRPHIHLVGARGGHLELLLSLRDVFQPYDRTWVTEPSARADALIAAGERVAIVPPYGRSPLRLLGHLRELAGLARVGRPRLVVSGGGGLTVPSCVLGRALGARVVMLETMARVTGPSMSGRVVSRVASAVLVQWPELAAAYPRTGVCRPALLEGLSLGSRPAPGAGTLVAVGTEVNPFDRLLRIVDEAAGRGELPAPIVAQSGHSRYQPRHFEATDWLAPDELQAAISRAEYVICHAGSGIVSAALRAGRRPLVLPRRAALGEMVDDHQLQLTDKLASLGLVVPLAGRVGPADLAAAAEGLPADAALPDAPPLADTLRDTLERLAGIPPRRYAAATA